VNLAGTNPFLVETDGRQGEWLALSYCWGGTQPVRTTLETSQQHYDSIAMSELPQTLQDAIFITRRLGYQYLWVDALCIIQDSKDDWESEVRKIGEVYAGVLLTFAAEAASCCESGIFESSNIHRKKLKVYPFTVRAYSNKNHVEGQIHFRPQLNIARTEANPLARRAWAFQEGILSTRVIHFAEQQVWWHCTEIDIQEATPDWVLYTSTWQSQFDPPRIFLQLPYHTNSSLKYPLALGLKNWLSTVSAFTRRDLSLNNDRLAAISGLAKRTAQILKLPERSYLGGLWSNDLHRALLWSNLERAFCIRHCQGIAPSWSWASIDTSGLKELFPFSGVYDRFLCTRPVSGWDAEISLQAPDELEHQYSFGSTYFGMLRVRGMCLELCRCQIPSCVLDCHEVEESVWGAEKLVKEKLSNCKCITRETSRIKTPETILIQICARNSVDVRAHVLILEAVDASEYQYERIDMAEIPV